MMDFLEAYPERMIAAKPSADTIRAFKNILPVELLAIWREEGWGVYMNGFLRFINPADYKAFVEEYVEIATPSIPFAVTAFGDILLWLKDGYVELVSFRKGYREIVEAGMNLFLNDTLPDYDYALKELKSEQYTEAAAKLGVPDFDKCFGYFPLLSFGGNESIDKIQIVDLQTHLALMAQAVEALN